MNGVSLALLSLFAVWLTYSMGKLIGNSIFYDKVLSFCEEHDSEYMFYIFHIIIGIFIIGLPFVGVFLLLTVKNNFARALDLTFGSYLIAATIVSAVVITIKVLRIFKNIAEATIELPIEAALKIKYTLDEQKEKRERALQAEIDEMVRQDQLKREKIINSHEYKEQQRREKRIEDARREVRRLTEGLADIPTYHCYDDIRAEREKSLKEAIDRLETLERAEKAFKHIDLP